MCDTTELLLISYETSKSKQMEDMQLWGNSNLDLNPAPYFQRTPCFQVQGLGCSCCVKEWGLQNGSLVYTAYLNMKRQ